MTLLYNGTLLWKSATCLGRGGLEYSLAATPKSSNFYEYIQGIRLHWNTKSCCIPVYLLSYCQHYLFLLTATRLTMGTAHHVARVSCLTVLLAASICPASRGSVEVPRRISGRRWIAGKVTPHPSRHDDDDTTARDAREFSVMGVQAEDEGLREECIGKPCTPDSTSADSSELLEQESASKGFGVDSRTSEEASYGWSDCSMHCSAFVLPEFFVAVCTAERVAQSAILHDCSVVTVLSG